MKRALRTTIAAFTLVVASASLTACDEMADFEGILNGDGSGPSEPLTTSAPSSEDMVADAKEAVATLDTLPERPDVDGYERGCGEGEGCVFGPRWTDDQDAPLGHNGCGTRDDVLAQQLDNVEYKEGSDCVVVSGTYIEPYFGTEEEFIKGEPQKEQDEIDHIIPLALAWDLGMSDKSLESRTELANDAEYNLVVSTNAANAGGNDLNDDEEYDASQGEYPGKSDMTAYEWLPYLTDTGRACDFSARYVMTADRYDLPVLDDDMEALQEAFSRC